MTSKNSIDSLVQAARKNAVHSIQEMVKQGADINDHNKYGATPLTEAATHGRRAAVECLLEMGATVNEPNFQAWTPLHLAVKNGHKGVVESLIRGGADVNAVQHGGNGWTPLLCAVDKVLPEIIALLLSHGARTTDTLGAGESALHVAIRRHTNSGATDVIKELLAAGANVNQCSSKENKTPLQLAVELSSCPVVEVLIAGGADIHGMIESGGTVLHVAARAGDSKMIHCLLNLGADVKKCSSDDFQTPLQAAIRSTESIKVLLEHEADINQRDAQGRTAFLTTVGSCSLEQFKVLRMLAESGADVAAVDKNHQGALHHAASAKDIQRHQAAELVTLLVKLGALINTRDSDGCTPLISAAKRSNWAVAEALLNANADASILDNKNCTALHYAASQEVPPWIARSMIEHDADIDQSDKEENTALHIAVRAGRKEIVDVLLEYAADVDRRNNSGETALMICAMNQIPGTSIGRTLLLKKASISLKTPSGWTAVTLAAKSLKPDLLGLLLKRLPPSETETLLAPDKSTLLHLAAQAVAESGSVHGHTSNWCKDKPALQVLQLALNSNVLVDCVDNKGRTALHLAVDGIIVASKSGNQTKMEQNTAVCKWLVKHGADLHLKDSNGTAPRDQLLLESLNDILEKITN